VTLGSSSAGKAFNYLSAETTGERIEVVMTLQRGKPPGVSATEEGLAAGVTVGGQAVRLDGQKVVFGRPAIGPEESRAASTRPAPVARSISSWEGVGHGRTQP
jgi:hypothetical protein